MVFCAAQEAAVAENVYALFIDIMGFAGAIEALTEEEHDQLTSGLQGVGVNLLKTRTHLTNGGEHRGRRGARPARRADENTGSI